MIKPYDNYSDPELIAFWQNGEEKAFDALYLRYVGVLVSIAATKVHSIDEAKEIVQEVFYKVCKRRDGLQKTASLKPYLTTALKNSIYNHYQKLLSIKKYEASLDFKSIALTDDLSIVYDAKELNLLLHKKIQELPVQCRKVFLLSRIEQLSHKEIATQLNISVNTVDQHIQKALRMLRESKKEILLTIFWLIYGD